VNESVNDYRLKTVALIRAESALKDRGSDRSFAIRNLLMHHSTLDPHVQKVCGVAMQGASLSQPNRVAIASSSCKNLAEAFRLKGEGFRPGAWK
jgi:hypothetical protein